MKLIHERMFLNFFFLCATIKTREAIYNMKHRTRGIIIVITSVSVSDAISTLLQDFIMIRYSLDHYICVLYRIKENRYKFNQDNCDIKTTSNDKSNNSYIIVKDYIIICIFNWLSCIKVLRELSQPSQHGASITLHLYYKFCIQQYKCNITILYHIYIVECEIIT